jgi:hypothetical protein
MRRSEEEGRTVRRRSVRRRRVRRRGGAAE